MDGELQKFLAKAKRAEEKALAADSRPVRANWRKIAKGFRALAREAALSAVSACGPDLRL